MAIAWIDANTLDQSQGIRFRPIRTQAQIEAEEREREIQEMCDLLKAHRNSINGAMCEKLHGFGYRKQGEDK